MQGAAIDVPLSYVNPAGRIDASKAVTMRVEGNPDTYLGVTLETQGTALSMLLDTACSGTCVRPQVADRLGFPGVGGPSMAGIGAGGVTQFSVRTCPGVTWGGRVLGDVPVVLQDLGPLPPAFDGILGLDLMERFAAMEIDFGSEGRGPRLRFYDDGRDSRLGNEIRVSETTKLQRTRLGVFACGLMVDGQGPARVLVDTGAACSLLNWRGAKAVGLTKNDPALKKLSAFGAMGVDGSAMALTHRVAGASITIRPSSDQAIPNSHSFISSTCNIDIGDIPVLGPSSPFHKEGIDGILGTDSLFPGVSKLIVDFRAALMYRIPVSKQAKRKAGAGAGVGGVAGAGAGSGPGAPVEGKAVGGGEVGTGPAGVGGAAKTRKKKKPSGRRGRSN